MVRTVLTSGQFEMAGLVYDGELGLTSVLPEGHISAALAYPFADDDILLVNLKARGWDLPGGHLEAGETPEEAMRREVLEEAGATLGPAQLFAYQWSRLVSSPPPEYKYPLEGSFMVFYTCPVVSVGDLAPKDESLGARLFTPEDAQHVPVLQFGLLVPAREVVSRIAGVAIPSDEHDFG